MRFQNICHRLYSLSRSFHTQELKIQDLLVTNYIAKLQAEYAELSQANVTSSRSRYLQPIIQMINKRNDIISTATKLEELLNDNNHEMRQLAKEEKELLNEQLLRANQALQELLLPVDDEDDCSSITLEVNSGVGGQEAMLFASELFDMYTNFVAFKGWQYELAEYLKTEAGGIRHGALLIDGNGVYKYLRHEAGVHRVQRVPTTEKSGRIHTSTVAVLALPQPNDIDVQVEAKDLRIDTKRATGAGGQHVNTTDSAVRIVHLPTGVAVECQTDRSQRKNKEMAMQRLRSKLYQLQLDAQAERTLSTRRSQVRSNFRNEKIRTYNFGQDRITDHRLEGQSVHNLKGFLAGGEQLEQLITKIDYNRRIQILKQLLDNHK